MKLKPMLCDETEDQNPGASFAAQDAACSRAIVRQTPRVTFVGALCTDRRQLGHELIPELKCFGLELGG